MRSARNLRQARRPSPCNWSAEAEAQLLRGLLTFRERVAAERGGAGGGGGGGGGLAAKLLNTPARSFDVEFARELQSLHLNVGAAAEPHSFGDGSLASTEAADVLDVSTDMLLLAADGQLRGNLRWKQPTSVAPSAVDSASSSAIGDSLPLLGGRLGYFLHQTPPPPQPPIQPAPKAKGRKAWDHPPGRLAYRKSLDGPRTQPDAEVERLLRSRTPTILHSDGGGGGGGWAPPPTTSPVPPAPVSAVSVARTGRRPTPTSSVSLQVDVRALVERQRTASMETAAMEASAATAVAVISTIESPPPRRSQVGEAPDDGWLPGSKEVQEKKRQRKRRKVTGLEMLNGIDAKPLPPPPTPPPSASVGGEPTLSATRAVVTATRPPRGAGNASDDAANAASVFRSSRGRSCLSQDLPSQSIERGSSNRSIRTQQQQQQQQQQLMSDCESDVSQQQRQRQTPQVLAHVVTTIPATSTGSEVSSLANPTAEQQQQQQQQVRLPVPDQYRVAHDLAISANRNAQLDAWLRQGKEPDDFFSCRTTTGSYSYFPRLPRYDRSLQPFDSALYLAPQYSRAVRQQFYGRKQLTPAFLAYGGKNPDNYLPPPVVTLRRAQNGASRQ